MPSAAFDPPSYLRIGDVLVPIWGDDVRGWSPRPEDFAGFGASPWVYGTLDELFFALVNLFTATAGEVSGLFGLGGRVGLRDHVERREPGEG